MKKAIIPIILGPIALACGGEVDTLHLQEQPPSTEVEQTTEPTMPGLQPVMVDPAAPYDGIPVGTVPDKPQECTTFLTLADGTGQYCGLPLKRGSDGNTYMHYPGTNLDGMRVHLGEGEIQPGEAYILAVHSNGENAGTLIRYQGADGNGMMFHPGDELCHDRSRAPEGTPQIMGNREGGTIIVNGGLAFDFYLNQRGDMQFDRDDDGSVGGNASLANILMDMDGRPGLWNNCR